MSCGSVSDRILFGEPRWGRGLRFWFGRFVVRIWCNMNYSTFFRVSMSWPFLKTQKIAYFRFEQWNKLNKSKYNNTWIIGLSLDSRLEEDLGGESGTTIGDNTAVFRADATVGPLLVSLRVAFWILSLSLRWKRYFNKLSMFNPDCGPNKLITRDESKFGGKYNTITIQMHTECITIRKTRTSRTVVWGTSGKR